MDREATAINAIRVLIADDDQSARDYLAELLASQASVTVVGIAQDAAEAVQHATDSQPDVAILDVSMPGGGPWAAEEIRRVSPGTKVIALSASNDRATVSEMLQSGAVGYLVKGATPGEVSAAVERAAAGKGSLSPGVILDVITELAEARDRAETAAAELGSLDETKRRIIGILSHELFTPITVIQGVAQTLATIGPRAEEHDLEALSSSVARASERLRRLVANIFIAAHLDRAEGARVELQPTSADRLLAAAMEEFGQERNRLQLHLDTQASGKTWPIDAGLARRALVAVIENALTLSPDAPVEIETREEDGALVVAVSDRGPGVPAEMRGIIFEPLRQVDESRTRSHEGLGLGLYLARRILSAHGGDIRVESREGGGSTFELRFSAAP